MKDLLNEATVEELRAVFLMATLKNVDFCGIISQLLLAGSLALAFKIRAEDVHSSMLHS
jgi:hypothetical protein